MAAKGSKCYKWEPEEDELLRKYRTRTPRLTVPAVARRLGRTKFAVEARITFLGLQQRPKRRDGTVQRLVRRHWRPGLSDKDLARKIRVGWKYVGYVRRKLGLPNGCDHRKKVKAGWATRSKHRPRCWGCHKLAGQRSPQWLGRNGWYYEEFRFRSGEGNQSDNECYCPECWKLARLHGMAGGQLAPPAGHSPPAGAGTRNAPATELSSNRLASANGTG